MTDRPPFASVEEAWFWTMRALNSRRDGTRTAGEREVRSVDPDDIVRAVDTLYRRRTLDLNHARVLRIYGDRGVAPAPAPASNRNDSTLWTEAMDRLGGLLRVKGLVA